MDDSGQPDDRPRHGRARSGFRVVRNLAAVVVIAGGAFLAVGLVSGDPRVAGLVNIDGGAKPDRARGAAEHPTASAVPRKAGVSGDGASPAVPPPGFEEQDQPLGQPPEPASRSTSYKFLATNADGSPVGYSPCRPLHYVVNAALAPEGGADLVNNAIETVSKATGIRFINDGATTEAPSPSRAPYQKDAYGERWAPLLIAWTTPEQAPQLKGPVIGTGGSTHFSFGDGPKSFVTGSLELDAPQIRTDLGRGDGSAYATAVILHELGHVMGLEHVDDPTQLMYPEIGAPDGLAAGDLNGLHELARAQCRKDL
ncbi:matrixin family metalloprotease [Arthrobacter sp. B3I4]|uniref:matrixin family metalloprotease n=1 Tax=Arthrobacter sp. B3I4 TaxID=3042267 RepID=UPI00278B99D5|nr:matrixin family metalloprotease [Arthrobacter sp. B3I4]MDQ0754056.1 hypothetical protein [Arthrobacter sp. B3I4]